MIIKFQFAAEQHLTEADITAFESRINKTLPDDYRKHMLKWNGGVTIQNNLEHKDIPDNGDCGLSTLYSIDYTPTKIEVLIQSLGSALEAGYIPIGSTRGGGTLAMSLKNDDSYGKIYVGFSEMDLYNLSPSFGQFLEDMIEGIEY